MILFKKKYKTVSNQRNFRTQYNKSDFFLLRAYEKKMQCTNVKKRKEYRQNINIMLGIKICSSLFVITAVIIARNTWSHETVPRQKENVCEENYKEAGGSKRETVKTVAMVSLFVHIL